MSRSNRVISEYNRLANRYDRRWQTYVEKSTGQTLTRIPLKDGAMVLDIGCGTGMLLAELQAGAVPLHLYGVDISSGMLEQARLRLGREVNLTHGCSEKLPFADAIFDCVTTVSSFHYWQDPERGLSEIHRVLMPNGALVITDWSRDFATCRLYQTWSRIGGKANFTIFSSHELARLLTQVGFTVETTERFKINFFWGMMCIVAKKSV